jgi:hypothetical protein
VEAVSLQNPGVGITLGKGSSHENSRAVLQRAAELLERVVDGMFFSVLLPND